MCSSVALAEVPGEMIAEAAQENVRALLREFMDTWIDKQYEEVRRIEDEGTEHYFEMKSAKPNKGQCIEMKHRLLTVLGIRRDPHVFVSWGVPYNPYGTAEAYAHPYPARFFDFAHEVKLGDTFWNFVG